jgi:chaperonin cofactor prefoldin
MTKKRQPKPTTLDDLAAMINQGFTETQQYIDKRLGGMDQQLDDMKGVLKDVVQELNATHEDVRYIRTTVNLLVRNDVAQDAAIKTLSARVARLEKKVGIAN